MSKVPQNCGYLDYSESAWEIRSLAAPSQSQNKTHPCAEMHLGCLDLNEEQQGMQLRYSPFSHKQSFLLGTEALKRASFTMSGVIFNWRNDKWLIVFPLLEITRVILLNTPLNQAMSSSLSTFMHAESQLWQSCFSVFYKFEKPPRWCLYSAWLLIRMHGSLRTATSNKRSLWCVHWAHVDYIVYVHPSFYKEELICQWIFDLQGSLAINIVTDSNMMTFVFKMRNSACNCFPIHPRNWVKPFKLLVYTLSHWSTEDLC